MHFFAVVLACIISITMMLALLITTWLLNANLHVSHSLEISEVSNMFEAMSEKMLSSLTASFSTTDSHRKKRELDWNKFPDEGVHRVVSIKPVASLCSPAVRTVFLDVSNTYVVCLTASTTDSPAEVIVGYYKDHTWIALHRWFVNNAVDAAAFYFKNSVYIVVADSEKKDGPDLLRLNLKTHALNKLHDVTGNYATSLAVWEMKINRQLNLAVANSYGTMKSTDLSTEVYIFDWKGTYFDRNATVKAYDVKDIEPFHINEVAYIAVANFRKGNSYRVDSEIFRFDRDKTTWVSHQKITTYGAMDFEFFTLGSGLRQEFFLAVANKGTGESDVKSMIYKFVEDKFVPFQCLPTVKATALASYSKDNVFLLAVANENDAVYLYQYDGWQFVKSGVQSTGKAMAEGVVHLEFQTVMSGSSKVLILSVCNPRHPHYPSVFEVGFAYDNSLERWRSDSTDWCLNTLEKLDSTDPSKELDFSDVIFTNQSKIEIDGDIIFEQGFVANTLSTPKFKTISTQEVFDYNLLNKLASLQKRLDVIKQKLKGFSDVLQNSLKIDSNQTIKSHLRFKDAIFNCKDRACNFANIYTEVLNGGKISDWVNKLIFTDSTQLNGTLMARKINAPNLNVLGQLDGVEVSNLVTKSGRHSIVAHKTFSNAIATRDIKVSGKVDGVKISSDSILLSTGHQTVTGDIQIENLNTTWLKAEFVNKRNLTEFLKDLVLKGKSYEISGQKTFDDITVQELTLTPKSTISGVDLVDLWENAFWVDGTQEIPVNMEFSDVMLEKNLDVPLGINGIRIPGPRVVDITEPADIKFPQEFKNSTTIGSLEVLKSLNQIPILIAPDGTRQLDILLKTGNQVVTGRKIFHTIHLDADSDVKGYVDGVDLSELASIVLRRNSSVVTEGTWTFKNLFIKGPLTIKGLVSNVNLTEVFERALKLNEPIIPHMIFKEAIFIEDLWSKSLNNIDVENDFVLVNKPQKIIGTKTFSEIELDEDSLVLGLVNNMNFSSFNEIMLVIGNQHVNHKTFKRNVSIKDLIVEGTINGIPVTDILSLGGGKIFGSRTLDGVTFSEIEAKSVTVTGKVNDIDIKEMIDDTLTSHGNQEVTGVKNIQGTVHIVPDANLQTENFNGIDLPALWNDVVFTDVEQEISGAVSFENDVIFDNILFHGTIDGVSEWEMKDWMLKNAPQVVEGTTKFENGFTANDLNVRSVNGLDLKKLESEIVKVNEPSEITGTVIFEKTVSSLGNVSVSGKVQGIDLSEEVVLRDHVVVTGEKRFTRDLVIEQDMTVEGLINGLDIDSLCNKTFLKNKDVNITRLIIKGDVTLEEGTVEGSLSGVDLNLLKDIVIKSDGSRIKFSGQKTFENVTFSGPVSFEGKFGSVDLKELLANYMSLSREQEISSEFQFDDLAFKGLLSVANLDTDSKEVNNIDLPKLSNRILRTSGTQNITATYFLDEVYFASDVFVAGKVNGLDLPSGLMRRNHTNYIQSPKIFQQPLAVLGNLDMERGKTIQGVVVSDWFKNAVLRRGVFQVHGHKIFNRLDLNDIRVDGTLDDLKFTEGNLLMVYGNQVVTGRKVVLGSASVEGSLVVNGLINKLNLTEMASTTVQKDIKSTITGVKYFTQPVTALSIQAPTIAGIDILELQKKLNTTLDSSRLENQLEEIEGVISRMKTAFDNQAILFQYYELFDEFSIPLAYDWLYISASDCGELLLLLDGSGSKAPCSSLRIFGFDKATNSFVPLFQELPTSHAVSVRNLMVSNKTLLFVANKNKNLSCSSNMDSQMTTVDIYEWNVASFQKIQSLPIDEPTDMVVFQDDLKACLVVLEIESKVYCRSKNLDWTLSEVLFTKGGVKASVYQSSKTILAVAAEGSSYLPQSYVEGQRYVDIYLWNSTAKAFSGPKQVIQSTFIQSVALVAHNDPTSERVFMVVSEGSIPKIHNKPKILIYRLDDESNIFHKYQEIEGSGDIEWLSLRTGELLLFVVDSVQGEINLYSYKGVSGFVKMDTVKSLGTVRARPFVRPDPEDAFNHYLALAGPHAEMAQPTQGKYHAKILKSKVKGKRPLYSNDLY